MKATNESEFENLHDATVVQSGLRERAESLLGGSRADISGMSNEEVQALVHELQVHQIELKLQNEELLASQLEIANSRDRFSDLYDFAPIGYLTLIRNGTIEQANLTAASLLGISRGALLDQKFSEFVSDGSQDDLHRHLQAAFAEEVTENCDLTIGIEETKRVLQLESRPILNDEGVRHILTALIDVTQQREVEGWVIQTQRLRSMVEHLPTGAIFVSNDQIELNRAAEEITGYRRDELTTLDLWFEKLFTDRAGEIRELYAARRREGFPCPEILSIRRKDGDERMIEFVAYGYDDHTVWLLYDVTKSKRVQAELAFEKARLESIVNDIPDSLMFTDGDRVITFCNPAVQRVFGYEPGELIGQSAINIYQNSSDFHRQGKIRFRPNAPKRLQPFEMEWRRKDGTTFVGETVSATIRDADGQTVGFLGLIRDVTERKLLESHAVKIADIEARRIGNDLHDGLGQELSGLSMMAEALVIDLEKAESSHCELAQRISRQLELSLEQVRLLARGLIPVEIELQGLANTLTNLAEQVSGMYRINCVHICKGQVEAPNSKIASHLFRIAQEAVSNGAKHGKADKIEIHLSQQAGFLELQIKDNGSGMGGLDKTHFGIGMRSMKYRNDLIGGRLTIEPVAGGRGTVVTCKLQTD